jgi:hypothetical protein
MIKDSVSIDEVVDLLNELIQIDKPAIAALLANRVPCNAEFADHPTVQCDKWYGGYQVGILGIINGMFGVHEGEWLTGWGPITATFDIADGQLLDFARTDFSEDASNP